MTAANIKSLIPDTEANSEIAGELTRHPKPESATVADTELTLANNTDAAVNKAIDNTIPIQPPVEAQARLIIKPTFTIKTRQFIKRLIPAVTAILMLYIIWAWAAHHLINFPSPKATWQTAIEVSEQAFNGKNTDESGLGWHIFSSLKNVLLGFIFAAAAGIPLGFMIGKYQFMSRMIGLIIGLFKPVSPLAWLPIGLLVFKTANLAAIGVVFLSAIWPIIINTAIGVAKAPPAYINVGKMLNLSEWEIISKILFPFALPNIMNGLRLAIGIAWLVIVAIEMLKSDSGIGFWLLSAWQQADYARILMGILLIGIIGFLLEFLLKLINKRAFHQ